MGWGRGGGGLMRVTGQRGGHLRFFSVCGVIVCTSSHDIPFAYVLLWVTDHRASVEPESFSLLLISFSALMELKETLQQAADNARNTRT